MYPQTHVYFSEKVFGRVSFALVLGSIFPDIAVGITPNRQDTHGRGSELLAYMRNQDELSDFAYGVLTHGINPEGLDYYGDEKFLTYEKGYCFEKGRLLVEETIRACNIPPEMGWWKSHNIIEMGIELLISSAGPYGELLTNAFEQKEVINKISHYVSSFYNTDEARVRQRFYNFSYYIDTSQSTPESLASRYDVQMFTKHHIHVNIQQVARLITRAAELVTEDLDDFFAYTLERVRENLFNLQVFK